MRGIRRSTSARRRSKTKCDALVSTPRASTGRSTTAATTPIHLPSPAEVEERILDLHRLCERSPIEAREVLRRVFNGRIEMKPQPDESYLAKTEILPLVLIGPETAKPQTGEPDWGFYRVYIAGCAGAQLDFPAQQIQGVAEVWVPFDEVIAVGWT